MPTQSRSAMKATGDNLLAGIFQVNSAPNYTTQEDSHSSCTSGCSSCGGCSNQVSDHENSSGCFDPLASSPLFFIGSTQSQVSEAPLEQCGNDGCGGCTSCGVA